MWSPTKKAQAHNINSLNLDEPALTASKNPGQHPCMEGRSSKEKTRKNTKHPGNPGKQWPSNGEQRSSEAELNEAKQQAYSCMQCVDISK
jgi:hypothetical protein